MAMRRVAATIKGISPLLMHRYPLIPIEGIEKKSPQEQAEVSAYRAENGQLYLPAEAMQRALIGAATYSKGKGRGSLQKNASACLQVSPMILPLGTDTFAIDSRRVVIAATKGACVRHRPRLDQWEATFTLEWDDLLLKETECRRILDDCGLRVGLLDFRPEKKGPFGRFMVTQWTLV